MTVEQYPQQTLRTILTRKQVIGRLSNKNHTARILRDRLTKQEIKIMIKGSKKNKDAQTPNNKQEAGNPSECIKKARSNNRHRRPIKYGRNRRLSTDDRFGDLEPQPIRHHFYCASNREISAAKDPPRLQHTKPASC